MLLTFVAPFSTSIMFDRKWMAYEPVKTYQYFSQKKLDFAKRTVLLGQWLLPGSEPNRIYLDTAEPGELFREYFIARQEFSIEIADLAAGNDGCGSLIKLFTPPEVCWLDRGVGYFTLRMQVSRQAIEKKYITESQTNFDAAIDEFADVIFRRLHEKIEGTTRSLLSLKYVYSDSPVPKISKNLYWAHKVWTIKPACDREILPYVASERTLKKFNEIDSTVWGWGDSIHICNTNEDALQTEAPWERGMALAQYFHTVLDLGLRRLPTQIERMRLRVDRGEIRSAQIEAVQHNHYINALITDFEIAKQLSGGQTREVLQTLVARWQTDTLSSGLLVLAPFLKELLVQSSETLKSWSQSTIETILFISTVIGFFGLSISLHDHLAPAKERFLLSGLALPQTSMSDPLIIAGLLFIVSFWIFLLSKIGFILQIFRSLRFQIKRLRHWLLNKV